MLAQWKSEQSLISCLPKNPILPHRGRHHTSRKFNCELFMIHYHLAIRQSGFIFGITENHRIHVTQYQRSKGHSQNSILCCLVWCGEYQANYVMNDSLSRIEFLAYFKFFIDTAYNFCSFSSSTLFQNLLYHLFATSSL